MKFLDRAKLVGWALMYGRGEERSNPETTSSNPADWFVDWVTEGGTTDAGVMVSEASAMRLGAVYACVRVLSEDLASLGRGVFQRRKSGVGKDPVHEHPASALVNIPNPNMTGFNFFEAQQGHVVTKGNSYTYIARTNGGELEGLWPLAPSAMTVLQDEEDSMKLRYLYGDNTKEAAGLLPHDVLHVRGLSSDGVVGHSPITLAREIIGLGLAAQKYGAEFFGGGASPDGVLTTDKALNKEQRRLVLEGWRAAHENKRNTAILSGGLKFEPVSVPPEEAQFIETRKLNISDVARIFRVPPHKIGDLERATFSNIEHEDLAYVKYSLMSWVLRWEEELTYKLFTKKERAAGLFVQFDFNNMLRADAKTRALVNKTAILTGWKNRNEVREADGLNPGPEELDDFIVPTNMVESDKLGDTPDPLIGIGDGGLPATPKKEEKSE